jgi:hypothetical protein
MSELFKVGEQVRHKNAAEADGIFTIIAVDVTYDIQRNSGGRPIVEVKADNLELVPSTRVQISTTDIHNHLSTRAYLLPRDKLAFEARCSELVRIGTDFKVQVIP